MIAAIMASTLKVNLDALIKREDFEIDKNDEDEDPTPPVFCLPELEEKKITFKTLRKPIFQRATSDWTPQQVVALVKNFVDRELIPAIIIWNSRSRLQFVMDGAHRLSALIAWVNDDYGAGVISQAAAAGIDKIPKAQKKAHDETKERMKEVGHYKDLVKVGESAESFGTAEERKRAKGMNSLQIVIQNYTKADPRKAEAAFYRINQGGTSLTVEEQEIIRTRRWPESIAARVLWRVESGRHYTLGFESQKTQEIERLAVKTHELLLKPDTTDELPLTVPVMSGANTNAGISLLDQFVHLANALPERKIERSNFAPLADTDPKIDMTGEATIEYLKKAKKMAEIISSGEAWSYGMHPLVYSYSNACKFLPGAFFAQIKLVQYLNSQNKMIWFAKHRKKFEDFLVANKDHLTKITHTAGSKTKSAGPLFEYWNLILEAFAEGNDPISAIQSSSFKFILVIPDQSEEQVTSRIKKGGALALKMRETLQTGSTCHECGARIYRKAWTQDHDISKSAGGSGHSNNLFPMHGVCNSGVKQKRLHDETPKSR
jgi:hypothetical protein